MNKLVAVNTIPKPNDLVNIMIEKINAIRLIVPSIKLYLPIILFRNFENTLLL